MILDGKNIELLITCFDELNSDKIDSIEGKNGWRKSEKKENSSSAFLSVVGIEKREGERNDRKSRVILILLLHRLSLSISLSRLHTCMSSTFSSSSFYVIKSDKQVLVRRFLTGKFVSRYQARITDMTS